MSRQDEPRQDEGGDREALAGLALNFIRSEVGDDLPGMPDQAARLADAVLAWMRAEGFRRHSEEPEGATAALRQHRLEWAAWLESWSGAVGVEPPTIEAVVNWLRADHLPFGVAAAEVSGD